VENKENAGLEGREVLCGAEKASVAVNNASRIPMKTFVNGTSREIK